MEFIVILLVAVLIFVARSIKVVPQQHAYVVERLGRYHAILSPGLNTLIPFIDRVAYKHNLKEIPLDVPSQICITKDNTQLKVDAVLYFQITDPQRASYGSSDYILAITQLAQTTLRSVIGKMELDKTFEERDEINRAVVAALDEAAFSWGVKVLRYEIKDLVPPQEILHAMQAQITAEREKRAVIATSEGRKMEQINLATGAREAAIQKSEGEMQAAINQSLGAKEAAINKAQGEAEAIRIVATATAEALAKVGSAVQAPGGLEAVNLKVAEQYVAAFAQLAKENNTLILPANVADVSGLVATAMKVVKSST
jgi:regulator of protease activity HflC (stomatin/prohibitin superfamily)